MHIICMYAYYMQSCFYLSRKPVKHGEVRLGNFPRCLKGARVNFFGQKNNKIKMIYVMQTTVDFDWSGFKNYLQYFLCGIVYSTIWNIEVLNS